MVEFTSGVTWSLLDLARIGRTSATRSQELITGRKVNSPEDDPGAWSAASRSLARASYLDAIHTSLTVAARHVSVADAAMAAIARNLDQMKGHLIDALACPPGDPVREGLIRSSNLVRRQIDPLVNTTLDVGARKLMADPALFPDAGDLPILADAQGTRKVIHAQPVHTGPTGLNVADLDAAASNADITSAIANLDRARQSLADKRFGLAADAANLVRHESDTAGLAALYQDHAQAVQAADATETALELKSLDVQRSLVMETLGGITELRAGLLELLR